MSNRRDVDSREHHSEESERKYHWPLGRRPDGQPELSDLGS
jgi:uncharacterized protein